jgi:tRNA threonylcarbamoyladenosine biosynthesis protein TsaE
MNINVCSHSEKETLQIGKRLAKALRSGEIVCMYGPLGSGKTALTRGIAQGLGIAEKEVRSPTFTLMNMYEGARILYHFDFYRINKPQELLGLGLEDFFYGQDICVVEWADKLGDYQPKDYLRVAVSHQGDQERFFVFSARGKNSRETIRRFRL